MVLFSNKADISFWYRCCVMGFRETTHSNYVFSRNRVCHSYKHRMSSYLDEDNVKRPVTEPTKMNTLWIHVKGDHSHEAKHSGYMY